MKGAEDQGDNGGLIPPAEFPEHPGEEFPEYPGDDNYGVIHPNGAAYWAIDANGVWRRVDGAEDESVDR